VQFIDWQVQPSITIHWARKHSIQQ